MNDIEIDTAYNNTFAIGGVSCTADTVLRSTFALKSPPIANLKNDINNSIANEILTLTYVFFKLKSITIKNEKLNIINFSNCIWTIV